MVPVVSKSVTKEPAARPGRWQNRGIMRLCSVDARLPRAFVTDLDIPRSGGARKALSVEEACGGTAGSVGELISSSQESGVAAGDAVGELVGVVLDPHGVGAGGQGA